LRAPGIRDRSRPSADPSAAAHSGRGYRAEVTQTSEQFVQALEIDSEGLGHGGKFVARQIVEKFLEQAAQKLVVGVRRLQLEQKRLDQVATADATRLEPLLDEGDGPAKIHNTALEGPLLGLGEQGFVRHRQVPAIVETLDDEPHPGGLRLGHVEPGELLFQGLEHASQRRFLILEPGALAIARLGTPARALEPAAIGGMARIRCALDTQSPVLLGLLHQERL